MKLVLIFWIFLEFTDPQDINILPGVIFDDLGHTRFIKGFLHMNIDLTCSESVFHKLNILRADILSLNNSYIHDFYDSSLFTEHMTHNTSYRIYHSFVDNKPPISLGNQFSSKFSDQFPDQKSNQLTNIMDSLVRQKSRLLSTFASSLLYHLDELINDPWILSYKKKGEVSHRPKRGLIDLGGHILKTLFGTATNDDISNIQQQIQILSDSSDHDSLLFSKLRDQLKENTINTKLISQTLRKHISNVKFIPKYLFLYESLSIISTYFSSIKSYLDVLTNVKNAVNNVLTAASHSKTSHSFFSFDFLQNHLNNASQNLDLNPIVPIKLENIHKLLFYSWTTMGKNYFSITTSIPFVEKFSFKTYHLISFPTPRPKLVSNRWIYVPDKNIFFIDKSVMKYGFMSDNQFSSSCLHIDKENICPAISPFSTISTSNCIVSLFTNYTYNDNKISCELTPVQTKNPVSILVKSILVISFAYPVDALLQCESPYIYKDIIVNGIFSLNRSCTLVTRDHKFFNPSHTNINVHYMDNHLPTFDIPTISENFRNHSAIEFFKVFDNTTNDMINKLPNITWDKQLDQMNSSIHYHSFHMSYLPYSVYTLATIIILIVIIFVLYSKCKSKNSTGYINDIYENNLQMLFHNLANNRVSSFRRTPRDRRPPTPFPRTRPTNFNVTTIPLTSRTLPGIPHSEDTRNPVVDNTNSLIGTTRV